jgi:hypothetical protein
MYGIAVTSGDISICRYDNGAFMTGVHGPSIQSVATGHWPWYLFEVSKLTGCKGQWAAGLLYYWPGYGSRH